MGYRSQVVAAIYPDSPTDPLGPEAHKEYMTQKYDALRFLMGTKFERLMNDRFGAEASWDDMNRRLVFEIDDVKWYEGYDHVQMFEKMLVDVVALGYCMEFARVGENTDDIELRYEGENPHYILNVQRTIVID